MLKGSQGQKRYVSVERWLRNEVSKSYDEHAADPSTGIPADKIMARLRTSHRARKRKK